MKKAVIVLFILLPLGLYAQITGGGSPLAPQMNLKNAGEIPDFRMTPLDRQKLVIEDSLFPSPARYSVFQTANINIREGKYTPAANAGGAIWQYVVTAPGAASIQLIFDRFILPENARLFLYDRSCSLVAGSFTRANMQEDSSLVLADFFSDTLVIEYYEPYDREFPGEVVIGRIGQAYRNMREMTADDEFININCSEGNLWQNEKHAVCFITFEEGGSGYMCSGALINNLKSDGTPYFLTANHCINTREASRTLVAYFNYEISGCAGFPSTNERTVSGSSILAMHPNSDYTLLQLYITPPSFYKPYYAGWDATGFPVSFSACIHHAEGNPKKIALDYDPVISYDGIISWEGGSESPANTHWLVTFDAGKTAGGSSGSPLFSSGKKIIGQLHGGDEVDNYYGKLSYSYTHSLTGYSSMKTFLDPDNTGMLICEAYYPASVYPEARFATAIDQVCLGAPVALTDYSAFDPVSWEWDFSPASVTYLEGTDRNSPDPVVSFDQAGPYDVILQVSNVAGTSTRATYGLISAGDFIDIGIALYGTADSCIDAFDGIRMEGKGASSFLWEILDDPENNFLYSTMDERTIMVEMSPGTSFEESVDLVVRATGIHGTCTDTARAVFSLIKQPNDHVRNAIPLVHGLNGPFSNCCSGVEAGEPIPPYTSCTGTLSWCDEYGTGEDIVEHSVWFTVEGPYTGMLTLTSEDIDNELALYQADSWQDILSHDYVLLAANDDQTEDNPFPLLQEVGVDPGTTYWLQVDGSGGGIEGYFTIRVSDNSSTFETASGSSDSYLAYPQPARDLLHIRSLKTMTNAIELRVYNSAGIVVMEADGRPASSNEIVLPVGQLQSGLYIVKISGTDYASVIRFIKD